MTDLINTIFERLNSPKPIFDEKITKTNLIPIVEELKNNDDDLTEDTQSYYQALRDHIEDGSSINDIELKFLQRELKKGN